MKTKTIYYIMAIKSVLQITIFPLLYLLGMLLWIALLVSTTRVYM